MSDTSDLSDPIALFPDHSRWRSVEPAPATVDSWREFPATLGPGPMPWGSPPRLLVPGSVSGTPPILLDGTRLTLDELESAAAGIPAGAAVCAVVADEDQARALSKLGGRLISLVVQQELEEPSSLAAFASLRALAVRVGRPWPAAAVRLPLLERLEVAVAPGGHATLTDVLGGLGLKAGALRELGFQGELDARSLRHLPELEGLEWLHLDWLPLSEPPDLAPLARLRRLRELALRGGAGLFEAAWEVTARLPRLRTLSLVSLAGEPVRAEQAPAGLLALRLEGRVAAADVDALGRLGTLRALHLAARSGNGDGLLDLEPLRNLRLARLSLQGDFRLDRPIHGLEELRWIAMPGTRALDLSSWTRLRALDLTLTGAWALRLPTGGSLERLRLQDVGETPVRIGAGALAQALSARAVEVDVWTDGLSELPPAWPSTLRTLGLSSAGLDDGLWRTLAPVTGLERLSLARAAITRPGLDAFLRGSAASLRHVELHDTGAARGRTLIRELAATAR